MFAFRFVAIDPFLAEIYQIPYLTLKFQGQGHEENQPKGQTHWSHLRPGVQLICLLSVSWQSDHFWLTLKIAFRFRPITPFLAEIYQIPYLT